jgi:hypothetical protein
MEAMFNRTLTTCLPALALAAVLLGSAANAAVIEFLADDFTGVTKNTVVGNPATIASWNTQSGVIAGTAFTAVDENGNAVAYEDFQTSALDVDTTVWGGNDGWDVSFTLALDGSTSSIALDSFDLDSIVTSNGGTNRHLNADTTYNWTVSITGDTTYGTQSASASTLLAAGPAPRTGSTQIDLSGLGDLVAGENYTVSIRARLDSGEKTYMALDSVSLSGELTVIPEPASLALLGLGGLLIARRRKA